MEFPLLPAQIQPHLQTFAQGDLVGRHRGGFPGRPQRRDAHRCGVPAEPLRGPDHRFLEGIFEELPDCHGQRA